MTPATASYANTHRDYAHSWWTPPEWLDWVSRTFDCDDWFDPCPSDWQPGDPSGLDIDWQWPCYVNHPGEKRGSALKWWSKYIEEREKNLRAQRFIWCAFNDEQLRHLYPAAHELDGYLVMPRERIGFIWGGPDLVTVDKKGKEHVRPHGERSRSPGNWTVFWSSVRPAKPPVDCIVTRTAPDLFAAMEAR